ncbi:hypothetical protein UPYG_G00200430 [Umbra pygmaea]|uniref:Protein moonraker n=1 Tax=Umbra pygmaea TaxID=75934 RepID=A0ABD0WNF5_UMBPY
MAATLFNESPMTSALGKSKRWVTLRPNRTIDTGPSQTQLLFNAAMPANAFNRATRVGPPAPIVIEKLMPQVDKQDTLESTGSSHCFSALSEERLLAAVRLAKRDLRRRRQKSLNSSPIRAQLEDSTTNKSNVEQNSVSKGRPKTPGTKEVSGVKGLVYTPQKYICIPPGDVQGPSPPTRNPGPRPVSQEPKTGLSQEVCRLQKELTNYIQKVEQLANRGRMVEEPLEPEAQRRVEVRRQEQASRSARILYVLQQQVKEIQEDLDKLRSNGFRHTKKSRAMNRLAAAHRGAVRAMQAFTNQLSDPSEHKLHSHYKELGQLVRQLSLCSAKVSMDQGSTIPETALDILRNLETLDTALSKQQSPGRRRQAPARSSSPAGLPRSPHHSLSPPRPRAPKNPAGRPLRGRHRAAGPKKPFPAHRRVFRLDQKPHTAAQPHPLPDRSQVLRAGVESLVNLRGLGVEMGHVPNDQGEAQQPDRTKRQGVPERDAGFQQATVASRLRVSQPPQKEASVPWVPTSPHSSPKLQPQQRSPQRRPEPRCLFSSLKPSSSPPQQWPSSVVTAPQDQQPTSRSHAHNEALRNAWLDKMTMRRLKELNQRSKEEAERIQRLRSELGSPTQWAERAELEARGRLQPLLDQALHLGAAAFQNQDSKAISLPLRRPQFSTAADTGTDSVEVPSEALLEDLLDDAARSAWAAGTAGWMEGVRQRQLQNPTLEDMLLRMEEIEKDQESVRRRFATITYSDPRCWDVEDTPGPQQSAPDLNPVSPQLIKIHRPAEQHTTTADIHLRSPVENGFLSDGSIKEDSSSQPAPGSAFPAPEERRRRGICLFVPASMQRSIHQYRQDHEAYLRLVAHEAVGNFNPWTIADRMADELMSEALADVAAEFQDVCEEYAEAVFTSEFLQPITSPPAPGPPLSS